MNRKFNIGDIVKVIDPIKDCSILKIGDIYTVTGYWEDKNVDMIIINHSIPSLGEGWLAKRFEYVNGLSAVKAVIKNSFRCSNV